MRPSTLPKSNRSALHSAGIGALLESSQSPSRKRTLADSAPRCAYQCEKCGLALSPRVHRDRQQRALGDHGAKRWLLAHVKRGRRELVDDGGKAGDIEVAQRDLDQRLA